MDEMYEKYYLKACDFIGDADNEFKNIIDKLSDDEFELLRVKFTEFALNIKLNEHKING